MTTNARLPASATLRPDALAKLGGNPGYLSDQWPADALHGAILGSPHPHARIRAIDTDAARALAGVVAVVTHADIPGESRYGLRVVDRPVLCGDKVRCVGDPVAAVAATSAAIARQALALIRVDYEPLPAVVDAEQALQPDSPAVHERGNLLHHTAYGEGDAAGALAHCTHVVEAEYETPRQMHAYLETEGGVVEPDGEGGWVVRFGCHNPERDRQVIAATLAVAPEKIRVVGTPVGGSYGGKDELTIQPIAALLAFKSGRAVRLHLSRAESVDLGVKRHAMRVRMRTGCDANGRLRLHVVRILADTGAYATHGPEVLDAAQEHAIGPYRHGAVEVTSRLAYTNNGIAGAFRGFGAVQVQFALEQQVDRLARAAGMDGAAFRRLNLQAPDGPGPLGQAVAPFDGAALALAAVERHPLWRERRRTHDGRWHRGVGLALVHRSDGFGRGGPNASRMVLALAPDGKIELRAGFTELGQNLLGTMSALMQRMLGCAAGDVRPVIGDSNRTPDSGPVAASRATTLVWRALSGHGAEWAGMLCAAAATRLDVPAAALRPGPGGIWQGDALRLDYAALAARLGPALPELHIELEGEETPSEIEAAHYVFGACAALAQVAVCGWTGEVRVEKLVVAAALGPVISPMGLLGQIEGGVLIGQGMATTEAMPMRDGRYLARNLDTYLVPTLADAPAMEIIPIEDLPAGDRIGPRGAGEIGVNIGAPVVANAIAEAIGAPVLRLPVAPDAVLQALHGAG